MKLVNEIIELASDGKQPLAKVLRKCLILAFDLKNDELKYWTEKELNGFDKDDELPPYRSVTLHSKGNFSRRRFSSSAYCESQPGCMVNTSSAIHAISGW